MKTYKITFSDGNTVVTGMNTDLEGARLYYINHWFQFGDTEENPKDHMVRGILVEEVA